MNTERPEAVESERTPAPPRVSAVLLKFLPIKYARRMLRKGEVRVATLREFRSTRSYSNRLLDIGEGDLLITLRGQHKASVNDLPLFGAPGVLTGSVEFKGELSVKLSWPDSNIYCTSGAFFTTTVRQARDDGKDACVCLLEPQRFFEAFAHTAVGKPILVAHCKYSPRHLIVDSANYHHFREALEIPPVMVKPVKYRDQREVRAVWEPRPSPTHQLLTPPGISDAVVMIRYGDVDVDAILKPKRAVRVGVRIKRKAGSSGHFSVKIPGELFTPVVADFEGTRYLAFSPQSTQNYFSGAVVRRCDFGSVSMPGISLWAGVEIASIAELRFFSEPL